MHAATLPPRPAPPPARHGAAVRWVWLLKRPSCLQRGCIVAAVAPKSTFERRRGKYAISDDPKRFDADAMHDFFARNAAWAAGRSREQTRAAAAASVVLGAYTADGTMVGGARIVTDSAAIGVIFDLYVLPEHRRRGLSDALVAAACEHPGAPQRLAAAAAAGDTDPFERAGFSERGALRWFQRPVPSDGTDTDGLLPDPRTAPTGDIAEHLLKIVAAEGPVTAERAFKLYVKGAGDVKVTNRVRDPLMEATKYLRTHQRITVDKFSAAAETQHVLRVSGAAAVTVREIEDRTLYEVPLNEIAELIVTMRRKPSHRSATRDDLKRLVLSRYGLTRKTAAAEQYLSAAVALASKQRQPTGTSSTKP